MTDNRDEAARWFAAQRRGVMLQDERAEFERWSADPANAARLAEFASVWAELGAGARTETAAPMRIAYRAQVAAMAAFVALSAVVLPRIDGGWWNTLDWWSR